MRKLLALVLLVGLVVVGVLAVRGGWLDGLGSSASNTAGPAPSAPTVADPGGIPADATAAVVEYVHDGDTLFLDDGRKVRLLGVNTPEIGENRECYGDEATALLRSLLPEGSNVWVQEDVEPLDQYGRSLLFVYTETGTNVNLALLAAGAAEVEMYRPNVLLADEIHDAEDAARAADLGLWGTC